MTKSFPFQPGDLAPDFSLIGDDEKAHRLSDFRGHYTVVYFYPKNDTPGCTQEACDFRDHLQLPTKTNNVKVVGISPDSLVSHKEFKEKYQLPFLLLSDPNSGVARRFGAYGTKNLYGKISEGIIRTTLLIDPAGHIVKVYPRVSVKGHVESIWQAIQSISE